MKSAQQRLFPLCVLFSLCFLLAMIGCGDNPQEPEVDPGLGQVLSMNAEISWTGVLLTWNQLDRSFCSAYLIQRSPTLDGAFETIDTADAFSIAFVDRELAANATYCYRLVALDNCAQQYLFSNLDTVEVAGSTMRLSDTTCLFDAGGGESDSIWVLNSALPAAYAWTAAEEIGWLSLTTGTGMAPDGFAVNADANTTGSMRSGFVIVTAEGIANSPETLRVAQAILGGILCPSTDVIEVPPLGGVDSGLAILGCAGIPSCSWMAESGGDWLTFPTNVGVTPSNLYLNVAMNNSGDIRSCMVTVAPVGYDEPPDTIIVNQATPFSTHVDYTTSGSPSSVWTDDFDGDGYVDLVATYSNQTYVSLFRNNGDGTFGAAEDHEVGGSTKRIRSADMDGDGYIDLVAVFTDGTSIAILSNDGTGAFSVSYFTPAISENFGRLCLDDCDGDDNVDIVSTNRTTGEVLVLPNDGTGNFSQIVRKRVGNAPEGVATANINNLGNVDLVTANSTSTSVSFVANDSLLVYKNAVSFMVETSPVSVCCGDFNRDNRIDVATACSGTSRVCILNNTGNTGSGRLALAATHDVVLTPTAIYPIDLNLDGWMDLAVGGYGVSILVNWGGTFSTGLDLGSPSEYITDLCTGDFDNDGDEDLAIANNTAGVVTIFENRTH